MTKYDQYEVKLAAFSVGLGQILMGLTLFTGPEDSLFVRALDNSGFGGWWAVVLIVLGSVVCYSSALPRREIRHHALAASMMVCMATFSTFLMWGRITLPSTLILWMGIMALASLHADICGHARVKLRKLEHDSGEHGGRAVIGR